MNKLSISLWGQKIRNYLLSSTLGPATSPTIAIGLKIVLRVSPEKLTLSSEFYVSESGFFLPFSGRIGVSRKLT